MIIIFSTDTNMQERWQNFLPQSQSASSVEELESHLKNAPDALVLMHTRNLDPYSTIERLHGAYPSLQLFVLEDLPSFQNGSKFLPLEIKGYGNAVMSKANLLQAVDIIQSGNIWLYPDFMAALIASLHKPQEKKESVHHLHTLTPAEQKIASLVAKGLSNKEIAKRQEVTERTVKAHLGAIYRKLDIPGRLSLALLLK